MKRTFHAFAWMFVLNLAAISAVCSVAAGAGAQDKAIASRMEDVDGVRLHYLTAGKGPAVILLHGYAETSRMWRPILPVLAERFTVIAPDLPGIGDSAIPADGLDMKSAAMRVHGLARKLGVEKARVVGHDIGLMVAYAYLARRKLTMPVLSIGGEKSLGEALAQQMKLVASDVTVVALKDSGHWIMEERPKETIEALVKFL